MIIFAEVLDAVAALVANSGAIAVELDFGILYSVESHRCPRSLR
jgi:hypothetical protein